MAERSKAKEGAPIGKPCTRCFCSPAASVAGAQGLRGWEVSCQEVEGEVSREETTGHRPPGSGNTTESRQQPAAGQGQGRRDFGDHWVSSGGVCQLNYTETLGMCLST